MRISAPLACAAFGAAMLVVLLLVLAGCSSSRLGSYANTRDWPRAEPSVEAKRCQQSGACR